MPAPMQMALIGRAWSTGAVLGFGVLLWEVAILWFAPGLRLLLERYLLRHSFNMTQGPQSNCFGRIGTFHLHYGELIRKSALSWCRIETIRRFHDSCFDPNP